LEKTLGSQGACLKNRHSDSLKESQITPSQRMMRKRDIIDDADDDDEVRTSA
jgi:hypothetical protein